MSMVTTFDKWGLCLVLMASCVWLGACQPSEQGTAAEESEEADADSAEPQDEEDAPDPGDDEQEPDPGLPDAGDGEPDADVEEPCECDDGDPCNGVETCDAQTGDCVAGAPVQCDDGDSCNGVETCDAQTGECVSGQMVLCDDGDPCNGVETCEAQTGQCVQGQMILCDDGEPCNGVETCDAQTGQCVSGDAVECDDGNPCNGLETCEQLSGQCVPGLPVQCSDGNACNGLETCEQLSGQCVPGLPVQCSDGDPCNGIETCDPMTGACLDDPAPSCPSAPSACDQSGGAGSPVEDRVSAVQSEGFKLLDDETWEDKSELVDRLAAHRSVTLVSLESILDNDLNRSGSRISVSGLGCFHDGFKWNSGDNEVEYWWPQGVTGSSDRDAGGLYDGKRVTLVSWYHKPEEDGNADFPKGVRISITDTTSMSSVRYRLAMLAEPVESNGRVDLEPISGRTSSVHAGGIVWLGDLLYVADTRTGFRVFDMSKIMQVQTGQRNKLGYDANSDEYYAYNYRYVIPQVGRYRLCESSCCARFSYVSLDRTSDPPRMIAGEYVGDADSARLHAWEVDEETGRLWTTEGGVQSSAAWFAGTRRIQGAAVLDGRFYISSSDPNVSLRPSAGSFFYASGVGGSLSLRRYPFLPEDLYYNRQRDELWTCTEYPAAFLTGETRYCFSFLTRDIRDGCD